MDQKNTNTEAGIVIKKDLIYQGLSKEGGTGDKNR